MARLQILELPEGTDDERPPFVLVVDQHEPQRIVLSPDAADRWRSQWHDIAERIGARGVIITPDTVEIPANEVPLDADGYPVRLRVEADLTRFRDQVDEALADMQRRGAEIVEESSGHEVERMDRITDALGLDRLQDWGAIVAAAKQLQLDGASGHHFGGTGYDDPLRCSKCGIGRTEWEARRDAPSCATMLLQKGLI